MCLISDDDDHHQLKKVLDLSLERQKASKIASDTLDNDPRIRRF